jgi:ribonucleoside-diphosphate reductase alpha chain
MLHKTRVESDQHGLLPTPPLPADSAAVNLTENARQVLVRRYVRRGQDGKPAESVEEMFWRVACHIAAVEEKWEGNVPSRRREFYELLTQKMFFPNSPTFTGAGTPLGQLAACFVLPISDDMGRDAAGIFQTLRDAALIQQTGGGNGFSFSRLRPKNTLVHSSAGQATGPVGFLRVYDKAFGEIAQGGCLLPETLVFTEKGLLRLNEIGDSEQAGWQPHSLLVATDDGWKESTRLYNNGIAPVLRVHTQEGLSLAGTPEHRVKIMAEQGPEWRMLKDLQPGDWILVRLGQHEGKLQALQQPRLRNGNQVFPKLPVVLDEEFAFFLGYMAGDGFVAGNPDDHRIGVSVAHSSYLYQEMPQILERLFGLKVHFYQKPQDRSVNLVIDNRAVKEFLRINGLAKHRSREVRVPRLIRQSAPEVVGAYLRGLFEADGSLSSGYPVLMTTSPAFAEEVATLLVGLGCPVRIRSVAPGVDHYGKLCVYHIRIESSAGLKAWRERIGCDLRSRFVSCYAWKSDLSRESTYVLPNPRYWFEPVLQEITPKQKDAKGRGKEINFRSSRPRLRRGLLRYLRGERNFTMSAFTELSEMYPEFKDRARSPEGLWFVRVNEVADAGQALTLDLEVDENHTYLAYGMVTHNTRRGANMAVLRVDHPDIEDFITCKTSENAITNFNISVGITDAFMKAVERNEWWELRFPDVKSPEYRKFKGTIEQAEAAGLPILTYKKVRARELFEKIVTQAHHNGEPGLLFLDAANRSNPVPHLYQLEATNPCGEQWLGPYENCCLGSINLSQFLGKEHTVDWEKLRQAVVLSTLFLDDVVEANAYVPAVPQLEESAHRARRIGLGIMGLSDLMYHAGIRYGSPEGQEFASQVMEFVRYHAMLTSVELARERGAFPAIRGSIYDPEAMRWTPPEALLPTTHDWERPALDWQVVGEGIRKYGIRNAAQTTVAPTGTIATVAGCEGYGCEPVFALAYVRHVNDNGNDLKLTYTSPLFEDALTQAGIAEQDRKMIVEKVMEIGSCQDIQALPETIRNVFVVSQDITAQEHVHMQAAMQAFVDNSLSKTINFPPDATVEDVAMAYELAWKLGCKGITVYVTGSRQVVVLETKETAKKKADAQTEAVEPAEGAVEESDETGAKAEQLTLLAESKKPRPKRLPGYTYSIGTPLGKAFITINENGGRQPFEVFINSSKAGSETAAVSEAIGRLISFVLRLASPVVPRQRLVEVIQQLSGIGGGRSMGFGPNRVRSLPDGVALALVEYLNETGEERNEIDSGKDSNGYHALQEGMAIFSTPADNLESHTRTRIGDLCPECGEAAVVNEEGCRKCYACGFSEC